MRNGPVFDLTESQQAALARIGCAVECPGGIALLCGPAGSGVTTVLGRLAEAAAVRHRDVGIRRFAEWAAAPESTPLPDVVLADDAHEVDAAVILAFRERCRRQRPEPSVVLAGQGRLLSLVARDPRFEQEIRLRAILRPFSLSESGRLVLAILSRGGHGPADPADLAPVMRTIHEIAGGIPAAVIRLSELAAVVADSRPDRAVSGTDVEAIHRRLSVQAA